MFAFSQGSDIVQTVDLAEEQETEQVCSYRIENQNGKCHHRKDLNPHRRGHKQHAQEHDYMVQQTNKIELDIDIAPFLKHCGVAEMMPKRSNNCT
jgi:hypothetical protein